MDGEVTFEAVVMAHRSLGRRGVWLVAAFLAAVSGLVSFGLWLAGAWPVIGFTGIEAAVAVWFLRRHALGPVGAELLLLTHTNLRVVRVDAKGRRSEQTMNTGWLRARLEERAGRVPALMLRGHGLAVEVASALGESEKRDLAETLEAALERQRRPDFDNPQLRDD